MNKHIENCVCRTNDYYAGTQTNSDCVNEEKFFIANFNVTKLT